MNLQLGVRLFGAALVVAILALVTTIGDRAASAQPAPPRVTAGEPSVVTSEQLAVLERVLARPEFQLDEGRSALDRLLDPVRSVLRAAWLTVARWLVEHLSGEAGKAVGGVGAWLAAGLVGLGLVIVLRLSRGTLAAQVRLAATSSAGPPRAEAELARAERLAAAGDLRGAVHHRYLAVLRRLDERDLLRFDQALTNRELLPRAATRPTMQVALVPLVEQFDRLWYGQSSCSPAEYATFVQLANRAWRAMD